MNLPHALGFFVLGLAMIVLPELAPALATPNAVFGSVATIWLQFMGVVIFLIGSGCTATCLAAAWPKSAPRQKTSVAIPAHARAEADSTLASTGNRAAI
jgi:hypothetical protein